MLILGVRSLKPNDKDDEEEEEPEASKDEAWKMFFKEDGELKPWGDVSALATNKVKLGLALREYIRRAWGKVVLFVTPFLT